MRPGLGNNNTGGRVNGGSRWSYKTLGWGFTSLTHSFLSDYWQGNIQLVDKDPLPKQQSSPAKTLKAYWDFSFIMNLCKSILLMLTKTSLARFRVVEFLNKNV